MNTQSNQSGWDSINSTYRPSHRPTGPRLIILASQNKSAPTQSGGKPTNATFLLFFPFVSPLTTDWNLKRLKFEQALIIQTIYDLFTSTFSLVTHPAQDRLNVHLAGSQISPRLVMNFQPFGIEWGARGIVWKFPISVGSFRFHPLDVGRPFRLLQMRFPRIGTVNRSVVKCKNKRLDWLIRNTRAFLVSVSKAAVSQGVYVVWPLGAVGGDVCLLRLRSNNCLNGFVEFSEPTFNVVDDVNKLLSTSSIRGGIMIYNLWRFQVGTYRRSQPCPNRRSRFPRSSYPGPPRRADRPVPGGFRVGRRWG